MLIIQDKSKNLLPNYLIIFDKHNHTFDKEFNPTDSQIHDEEKHDIFRQDILLFVDS